MAVLQIAGALAVTIVGSHFGLFGPWQIVVLSIGIFGAVHAAVEVAPSAKVFVALASVLGLIAFSVVLAIETNSGRFAASMWTFVLAIIGGTAVSSVYLIDVLRLALQRAT